MRRSVREAIVGFSLIAAVSSAVGLVYWLRGANFRSNSWTVQARFQDASGLAERSPVVYRGVLVGNVRSVKVTTEAVLAQLEINNPDLLLAQPVRAEIGEATLLGGEAEVKLLTEGDSLPPETPGPLSKACNSRRMLCNGGEISGTIGATLETMTTLMEKILQQVDEEDMVGRLAKLSVSFDQTSRQATDFIKEGRQLVRQLDGAVRQARPSIDNLNATTAHVRNLTAALDDPKTVTDLRKTLENAERLTARWEAVGGDVSRLSSDPAFMNGMRSVTIGLGKFFEELYPEPKSASR
ncbi:MAG: MlaD family protein [Cyanobacteriota bacterium]|nr:MlaD family protein [Cyanobacteriota bacterium]